MLNRTIGTGGLVMMLVIALAAMGIGIALWSKVLTIQGIVRTGSVNAEITRAFTDDDDVRDHPDFDFYDTGDCPIHASPLPAPTSCDPKETGREPQSNTNHRYDKDVARCDAGLVENDQEPQPGIQRARVIIRNGYPSYHCTAWFLIHNNGTIPIHLHSATIQGVPATLCQFGSTPYDLDGDTQPDVEICLSGLPGCDPEGDCRELQIHPSDTLPIDLDIHIMQTAHQDDIYEFLTEICFHQWNEEIGFCPQPKVLLYSGNAGYGTDEVESLQAHYEGLGYHVDNTAAWPSSLSEYSLVYINGPGLSDDSGAAYFSAAQKGDLNAYMAAGGRVVVAGDHSGLFGVNTVNDLLAALSGNISQNADLVTPNGDACPPMTDITANTATAGVTSIDPSATSSLTVSGSAVSLARVDAPVTDCGTGIDTVPGATFMARDGRLVVLGDLNILDDFAFSDPLSDGNNAALASALVSY